MKADESASGAGGSEAAESVTGFTRRVKRVLEEGIPPCWVRGEISNLRAQSSGHVYFSLKDPGAQLSAVLFRGDALRQTVELRDGLQVVVYGQVGVYEPRGQYQLIVRVVVEDGVGRLQKEFEALKRRLAGEGLFDPERRKPIPAMPATVGIITSPTGAALQDFIRILRRRGWRGRLVVFPSKVQGEGAAAELAEMLRLAQTFAEIELLVIGRGGGSLEDLWAFNEEPLVRAVAASRIPVISAVGHEIDVTLCDFAADARAETPSGAAELISSRFIECLERLERGGAALDEIVDAELRRARDVLGHSRDRLRLLTPSAQVERGWLRLDDMANRIGAALRDSVHDRRHRVAEVRARLGRQAPETRVEMASLSLVAIRKRLAAASPSSVLNRGFAIVRDENGRPLGRRKGIRKGQRLTNEFADGSLPVRAD